MGLAFKEFVICSRYTPPEWSVFKLVLAGLAAAAPEPFDGELFPAKVGPIVRRPRNPDDPGAEAGYEALSATFGMLPHWADPKLARQTYNARSESVATKPSFRNAWAKAQHCLIPVQTFYEPDWRSGKAVPTRFELASREPMCVAGLWERRPDAVNGTVWSYTMLTVNADAHELLRHYHRPGDEKRMLVILPRDQWDAWLDAPAERSMDFMRQFPAELLTATPEPRAVKPKPERAQPKINPPPDEPGLF